MVFPSSESMGDAAHEALGTSIAFSIAIIVVLNCSYLMYALSAGWSASLGRDVTCGGACLFPCGRCVAMGCESLRAGILDLAKPSLREKNPGAAHKCGEQGSPLLHFVTSLRTNWDLYRILYLRHVSHETASNKQYSMILQVDPSNHLKKPRNKQF